MAGDVWEKSIVALKWAPGWKASLGMIADATPARLVQHAPVHH